MFGAIDRIQDAITRLGEEIRRFIRAEIELAKAEVTAKVKVLAVGAAFAGAAAVLLFFSTFAFLIAAIWGLATVMPVWAAALLVGIAFVLAALLVGWFGYRKLSSGTPTPDEAIAIAFPLPDEVKRAAIDPLTGDQPAGPTSGGA